MERRIKFWGRGEKKDREVERKSKKGITGKRKRMRGCVKVLWRGGGGKKEGRGLKISGNKM